MFGSKQEKPDGLGDEAHIGNHENVILTREDMSASPTSTEEYYVCTECGMESEDLVAFSTKKCK